MDKKKERLKEKKRKTYFLAYFTKSRKEINKNNGTKDSTL